MFMMPGPSQSNYTNQGNFFVAEDSVFLKNYQTTPSTDPEYKFNIFSSNFLFAGDRQITSFKESAKQLINSAILNVWQEPNNQVWGTFLAPERGKFLASENETGYEYSLDISNNFWGGASETLIGFAIKDFDDDYELGAIEFLPVLDVCTS
jgi:hypothetical protein